MSLDHPVITVDGPSGAGKGTLSLWLAEKLRFHLLDSGALYRLSAMAAKTQNIDLNDEIAVAEISKTLKVSFKPQDGSVAVMLDGQDVSSVLRTEDAGMAASKVAALPKVREALVSRQRNFVEAPGLVADGRDMGTTIFPGADAKIFLTASAETRAKRRFCQLQESGVVADYDKILEDIRARDDKDSNRSASPLKPADDALLIDSSHLTIDSVCAQALEYVRARLGTD